MAEPGRQSRRGDLKATLLAHGIALARAGGPAAVSLRDVQRRAGVSNTAAYRHYADREALLVAISAHASAEMARTMEAEMAEIPTTSDRAEAARARFRATGSAYLHFALSEPGLFAVAFLPEAHPRQPEAPPPEARGDSGLGPFQLVQQCIDELVEAGALAPELRGYTDVAAWAAVHGLANLLLEGPLVAFDAEQREAAMTRLLDIMAAGIH
ncbi:TetR family transcriptional regulator [Intrasporangium oryzae NRRL B-24470]|uniref:TetR family transcriptional regulator n=1 Tax=Intrasporangium oryzae NRRL B-24470 TaxID=1386089 RepID=W9GAW3_9MICO|nr:TetR/AcrR family transcriptional regulator [Intrasporangium oryzae]EWT01968.1 TetR family transcriptional regulator [Intrasporangium oryzae NRRL B-24470]